MSSIVEAIKRTHKWADDNNWPIVYWAVDLHGTILKPSYERGKDKEFYPYAKECLEYISNDKNNVLILFSSSWPAELNRYQAILDSMGIKFKYANSNPEVKTKLDGHGCYYDKFYFNVMLEDKAGFDPENDWEAILDYMKERNAA